MANIDFVFTNLETLNLKQLQALAKEHQVKNWWTMKKANLLEALTLIQNELKDEEHLTEEDVEELVEKTQEELDLVKLNEHGLVICTHCSNKDCPHREAMRRNPVEVGGLGLCPKLAQKTTEEAPQEGVEEPQKEAKSPKKEKAPKVEKDQDNLITIKELAAEFNMKGTKARRLLRNESALRPFGSNRWEWDKVLHTGELDKVRKILEAHTK